MLKYSPKLKLLCVLNNCMATLSILAIVLFSPPPATPWPRLAVWTAHCSNAVPPSIGSCPPPPPGFWGAPSPCGPSNPLEATNIPQREQPKPSHPQCKAKWWCKINGDKARNSRTLIYNSNELWEKIIDGEATSEVPQTKFCPNSFDWALVYTSNGTQPNPMSHRFQSSPSRNLEKMVKNCPLNCIADDHDGPQWTIQVWEWFKVQDCVLWFFGIVDVGMTTSELGVWDPRHFPPPPSSFSQLMPSHPFAPDLRIYILETCDCDCQRGKQGRGSRFSPSHPNTGWGGMHRDLFNRGWKGERNQSSKRGHQNNSSFWDMNTPNLIICRSIVVGGNKINFFSTFSFYIKKGFPIFFAFRYFSHFLRFLQFFPLALTLSAFPGCFFPLVNWGVFPLQIM